MEARILFTAIVAAALGIAQTPAAVAADELRNRRA
jgi:hypothetical protein